MNDLSPSFASHAGTCKICNRPLVLKVDASYNLTDPYKLFPLATCNRCYDLRDRRDKLETQIFRACTVFHNASDSMKKKIHDRIRAVMEKATHAYALVYAEQRKSRNALWDMEVVNLLMENAGRPGITLQNYRRQADIHFRDRARATTAQPSNLHYHD